MRHLPHLPAALATALWLACLAGCASTARPALPSLTIADAGRYDCAALARQFEAASPAQKSSAPHKARAKRPGGVAGAGLTQIVAHVVSHGAIEDRRQLIAIAMAAKSCRNLPKLARTPSGPQGVLDTISENRFVKEAAHLAYGF